MFYIISKFCFGCYSHMWWRFCYVYRNKIQINCNFLLFILALDWKVLPILSSVTLSWLSLYYLFAYFYLHSNFSNPHFPKGTIAVERHISLLLIILVLFACTAVVAWATIVILQSKCMLFAAYFYDWPSLWRPLFPST